MSRPFLACLFLFGMSVGCGGSPTPGPTVPEEEDEAEVAPDRYAVALRLEDAGTDEEDMPHTRVSLIRISPEGDRSAAELHNETGACYLIPPTPPALIAARCWWAGQGSHYSVTRTSDSLVATRTVDHEDAGPGEPEEVGRLELDREAELQVLGGSPPPPPN